LKTRKRRKEFRVNGDVSIHWEWSKFQPSPQIQTQPITIKRCTMDYVHVVRISCKGSSSQIHGNRTQFIIYFVLFGLAYYTQWRKKSV